MIVDYLVFSQYNIEWIELKSLFRIRIILYLHSARITKLLDIFYLQILHLINCINIAAAYTT